MDKFKKEYNLILKYLKNEKIISYNIITSSWCNNVFIINNKYTFKFPKIYYDVSIVENESRLTHSIYNFLNINIPKVSVIKYDNIFFVLYDYIEGIEYKNLLPNYIYLLRKNISNNLSNFIIKLHSIDINNINYLQKSNFSMNEPDINLYNRYNVICDFLKNTNNLEDFKRSFDYIDNIKLNEEDICLLHNDLNEENFLIDIKTKKISGVIDFSNAKIGNFNEEFAQLSSFDYKLVADIVKKYQKITNKYVNLKYSINVQKMRYYAYICNSIETKKEFYINNFLYNKIPSLQLFENML